MNFSTLTLIFGITMTITFMGTVSSDLRPGAFALFLLGLCLVAADGFLDYSKAKAQGAYGAEALTAVSPAAALAGLLVLASIFGVFIGA